MDWSEKIDNKKYFGGTFIAVVFALVAGKWRLMETAFLLGIVLGTMINQWLMFVILGKLLQRVTDGKSKVSWMDQMTLWLQVGLKFFLLGALFYYLVIYARHVAAQGLLLYTFQLIILILSIKNISDFFNKKGSP